MRGFRDLSLVLVTPLSLPGYTLQFVIVGKNDPTTPTSEKLLVLRRGSPCSCSSSAIKMVAENVTAWHAAPASADCCLQKFSLL